MAKNILREAVSPKSRKKLYVVFAIGALALGAAMTGFGAAAVAIPVWLTVINQVFWYVAAAFGITAASNTFENSVEVENIFELDFDEHGEAIPDGTGRHRLEG